VELRPPSDQLLPSPLIRHDRPRPSRMAWAGFVLASESGGMAARGYPPATPPFILDGWTQFLWRIEPGLQQGPHSPGTAAKERVSAIDTVAKVSFGAGHAPSLGEVVRHSRFGPAQSNLQPATSSRTSRSIERIHPPGERRTDAPILGKSRQAAVKWSRIDLDRGSSRCETWYTRCSAPTRSAR